MIDQAHALIGCVLARWSPEIGDPSVMGWVTVVGYLAASALSMGVLRADRFPVATRRMERMFWLVLSVGLALLAVNKQLDLQSAFTAAGRCAARLGGWYEDRRVVQTTFILVLAAGIAVVGMAALATLRPALPRLWLAFLGAGWLAAFVLVRAVGFHHVDALIGLRVAGMRMNWVFELGGIALVSAGAAWALNSGGGRAHDEDGGSARRKDASST